MRRRAYLAGLAGTGTVGLAGCTALGDNGVSLLGSEEYDVGMTRMSFEPRVYEITVGETVVWKNTSEARHTVTAYEGSVPDDADYFASGGFETQQAAEDAFWDSSDGGFNTRETYEHTFDVPGEYAYFCIPHEIDGNGNARMTGQIEVVETDE